jgi:hypothetical protein
MMSFTTDGQLDPALLAERDRLLSTDTAAIRASRAGWPLPAPHPAADHPWRSGRAWAPVMQLQDARLAGGPQQAAAEARERAGDGREVLTSI